MSKIFLSYISGIFDILLLGMIIGEMLDCIVEKYLDIEVLVCLYQDICWIYKEFVEKVNEVV